MGLHCRERGGEWLRAAGGANEHLPQGSIREARQPLEILSDLVRFAFFKKRLSVENGVESAHSMQRLVTKL